MTRKEHRKRMQENELKAALERKAKLLEAKKVREKVAIEKKALKVKNWLGGNYLLPAKKTEFQTETVEQFLARGGEKTRLPFRKRPRVRRVSKKDQKIRSLQARIKQLERYGPTVRTKVDING